ncbi:MAG: V-type ATPase subunit, partial [Synergistaceae bacterium]|nr:V-type ATPase subunit [Synergistaceae bacterium]
DYSKRRTEMSGRKYDSSDFLYLSSRLKALEAKNLSRDRYERMIGAKSPAEAYAVLAECEYGAGTAPDGNTERLFEEELKKYYDLISRYSPDKSMVDFFLYFYDCHNLKSLIKAELAGTDEGKRFSNDEGKRLFIGIGAIPYETALASVRDRNFSRYMQNVAATAPEAIAGYAASRDPMLIDIDIDRAMYADLDLTVKASNLKTDFLRRYFARRADLVNIITAVRIFRLGYEKSLLSRALVPGGSLGHEFFTSKFEGGEEELFASLSATQYSELADIESAALYRLEKAADDILNSVTEGVRFTPFGAEPIIAFMIAKETEVRNARVILSGKAASLDPGIIRERLRTVYV